VPAAKRPDGVRDGQRKREALEQPASCLRRPSRTRARLRRAAGRRYSGGRRVGIRISIRVIRVIRGWSSSCQSARNSRIACWACA